MKKLITLTTLALALICLSGCDQTTSTLGGAALGTGAGAAIGNASGNTALGAVIGDLAGAAAGSYYGHQENK